jgi:hypothetical protein
MNTKKITKTCHSLFLDTSTISVSLGNEANINLPAPGILTAKEMVESVWEKSGGVKEQRGEKEMREERKRWERRERDERGEKERGRKRRGHVPSKKPRGGLTGIGLVLTTAFGNKSGLWK